MDQKLKDLIEYMHSSTDKTKPWTPEETTVRVVLFHYLGKGEGCIKESQVDNIVIDLHEAGVLKK